MFIVKQMSVYRFFIYLTSSRLVLDDVIAISTGYRVVKAIRIKFKSFFGTYIPGIQFQLIERHFDAIWKLKTDNVVVYIDEVFFINNVRYFSYKY